MFLIVIIYIAIYTIHSQLLNIANMQTVENKEKMVILRLIARLNRKPIKYHHLYQFGIEEESGLLVQYRELYHPGKNVPPYIFIARWSVRSLNTPKTQSL